jgi:dipeptidyl aminopeptidase/acylaminoacyl peptidase
MCVRALAGVTKITGIAYSLGCLLTSATICVGAALANGLSPQADHAVDSGQQAAQERPISIQDLIEVNTPTEVAISPNGRWVSFVLQRAVIEKNHYLRDLYVVPTDGSALPRQLTHSQPRDGLWASVETMSAVWAPASNKLAYVAHRGDKTQLHSIDVETGNEEILVSAEMLGENFKISPGADRGPSIAYSPDGNSLAFLASMSTKALPTTRSLRAIEAGEDWAPETDENSGVATGAPVTQLFTFQFNTHQLHMVTQRELNVSAFAWSPDGQHFALEAETNPAAGALYMRQDIYVVETAGGKLRPLVQWDGIDRSPVWSPDGKQIAFCTQHGKIDWMQVCSLAVVAADGLTPPRILGAELDQVAGPRHYGVHWAKEGRFIDLLTRYHLSKQLFRISTEDGKFERLSMRDDRMYDEPSYSRDGRMMAFRIQGVGLPPDIYTSAVTRFRPKALTHLNPSWNILTLPKTRIVQWRSQDDRWDVHGLLIEPSHYDPKQRYPMLTAILGGPIMVDQELNPDSSYPLLALAEQGYVILMPNSRGREGFGMDFDHAIRDERSYVLNPETDIFSGVDAMVARGVADPDRLGILGFSYGGTLTAYAVTLTNRFKAAIYGEGTPDILRWYDYANTTMLPLLNDMWGFGNPYEPKEIASAIKQSSLFRLNRVHTPVLVEAGELSGWKTDRAYYRGLRHFQVPAEFYVYPRSGHGWDEPKLIEDAFKRHIAWLDYWIKGKPYPDAKKQQIYDAWKLQNKTQPIAMIERTRR